MRHKIATLGVIAALSCEQACAVDASRNLDTEAIPESVARTESALTAPCPSFDTAIYDSCFDSFDDSGFVQTRIYTCKPFGPSQAPSSACPVESSFAPIGGGAAVTSSGAGGLLVYSMPITGGWFAISKSHVYSDAHWITSYAIGLKLKNYPAASLKNAIKIDKVTSAASAAPLAVAPIPGDHVLLGGGAKALNASAG